MRNFYAMSPEDQKEASFRRLADYIEKVLYPYHPYYRRLFDKHGVKPAHIRKPSDLLKIPLTFKDDYRPDPMSFILQPRLPGRESIYDTQAISPAFLAKYIIQSFLNLPRDYAHLYRRNYGEGFAYGKIGRRISLEWMPIHFHASAGSTGDPTPVVYTYRDLHRNVKEAASAFWCGREVKWDMRAMNVFPGAPHLAFFQVVMGK